MDVLLSGCVASGVQLERKKILFFFSKNIWSLNEHSPLPTFRVLGSVKYHWSTLCQESPVCHPTVTKPSACWVTACRLQWSWWSRADAGAWALCCSSMVGLLSLILIIGNFYSTCSVRHILHLSRYELCYYYYNDINLLSLSDTLFYHMYGHTHDCVSGWLVVWNCCSHYAECYRRLLFCEWPTTPLWSQPLNSADVTVKQFCCHCI